MDNTQQRFDLHLKQTFPPIIRILSEGEGDEIESRLPFKIFSTLLWYCLKTKACVNYTLKLAGLKKSWPKWGGKFIDFTMLPEIQTGI